MKKLYALAALLAVVAVTSPAYAQMMGNTMMGGATGTAAATEGGGKTAEQEEAEGKAVWDKLQSKEVACKDLTDGDFDVLADFFMGNIMGANHEAMNDMMAARLGEDGEEQMHIAMGKRLSGCDTSAALPEGSDYFMPMMGGGMGGGMMMGDDARFDDRDGGGYGMMGDKDFGRGRHGGGGFEFFGALLGLSAFGFFTTGMLYYLKKLMKHKSKERDVDKDRTDKDVVTS